MLSLSTCYRCRHYPFARSDQWSVVFRRDRNTAASPKPKPKYQGHFPQKSTSYKDFDPQAPSTSRNYRPRVFNEGASARQPQYGKFNNGSNSRPWNRREPSSKPPWTQNARQPYSSPIRKVTPEKTQQRIKPKDITTFFENGVERWSQNRGLGPRLVSFGIPENDVQPLIKAFVSAVQSGELSTPEAFDKYILIRFSQDLSLDGYNTNIDILYSTILFTWASDNPSLAKIISPTAVNIIQALKRASDRSHPAEEFPLARSMQRKVIMHVGPTNSGKTHNALRALAAANSGVYAGPLRLLAHEIWERLNLGQIVPLGAEEAPISTKPAEADTDSALDIGAAPVIKKQGNPRYARECNMITGEEHKIVRVDAPLVSCTVEMLPTTRFYDVAVVDEIQMIADERRGGGWTNAVLGLCARELHLCGEETAVPLIQALLKDTGDELIVNRYERLTPLQVEAESLEGDFSRVQKGDCIVTFSRSSIFAMRRLVEDKTGIKCALVYGKLPSQIRSDQAALFNDPNSGYDVIIGSDAIGMGLNLYVVLRFLLLSTY